MGESAGTSKVPRPVKLLLFANTEWYLFNFRLALRKLLARRERRLSWSRRLDPMAKSFGPKGFVGFPCRWRGAPMREAFVLCALWRLYRRERPDIAHHFTIKCVIYGGLAAKGAGTRGVVNAVTGMGYVFSSQELLARILRPLVRSLLRFAMRGRKSRLIVQSAEDRLAIVDASLMATSQVRLIAGSGVDTQRYRPRADALCARMGLTAFSCPCATARHSRQRLVKPTSEKRCDIDVVGVSIRSS